MTFEEYDAINKKYDYKGNFNELQIMTTSKEEYEQLVDRATPKKVEYFNDECCCAACGCKLFAARPVDFCPDCGQALDWRDIG